MTPWLRRLAQSANPPAALKGYFEAQQKLNLPKVRVAKPPKPPKPERPPKPPKVPKTPKPPRLPKTPKPRLEDLPRKQGRKRLIFDGLMMCKECEKMLPLSDFYKHISKRSGRQHYDSRCNPCRKDRLAGRRLGLSAKARRTMIDIAGGLCQICGIEPKRPHIDHCHSSGKIRGVLCAKCNQGIAMFIDRPDLLRTAAVYLETA